jgi:hypothetical protein
MFYYALLVKVPYVNTPLTEKMIAGIHVRSQHFVHLNFAQRKEKSIAGIHCNKTVQLVPAKKLSKNERLLIT